MTVIYKNTILAKGSRALELWQQWQSIKTDRPKAQKTLDDHLRQLDKTYQETHYERYARKTN